MPYKDRERNLQYWKDYSKRRAVARKQNPALLQKYRARACRDTLNRRKKVKALITSLKKDKPCIDCGIILPPDVMDFDHVRGEKLFPLCRSTTKKYRSFIAIEEEAKKCDIRCPNCHRMRHYRERITCEANQ
jgi:hypothetical protein